MRVKICGITQAKQGVEIAQIAAITSSQAATSLALGFICVERSPRYIKPEQIKTIIQQLPANIDTVGVFANASLETIAKAIAVAQLTAVQLHGKESPDFCHQLRQLRPSGIEIIKAFRIKTSASLTETTAYLNCVDTLLLDAYHPQMLGGTGQTLNWSDLARFKPPLPWMLAGGLTPDNIQDALSQLKPSGIDLSSGVERSPGDKNIDKVIQLFQAII
ncbi:MAG: phosphoribosylanthranilate isomerase [Pleurocapsa sp.]